jgi:hypothetical protein
VAWRKPYLLEPCVWDCWKSNAESHPITSWIIIFILYFYYFSMWGTLWHFTNFLTINHSWICPPPLFLFPYSWNSFNRSYFSIYIHVYRIFPHYSPSNPFSLYPPPTTGTQSLNRTCFAFCSLFFKKKIVTFLFV